ncbi:MAG: hypothetical protein ACQEVA_17630 [Myxococcota bacterium]
MRYRWTIPIIALVLLLPSWALAQSSGGGAPTMQAALEQALASEGGADDSLDVLIRSGATFEKVLVAEVTPDNRGVVADLGFDYEGRKFRFPVKLERSEPSAAATWRVAWLPDPEYARALIGAVQGGPLPRSDDGAVWVDAIHLPSLPVIVRSDSVFTPYGRGALVAEARAPEDQKLMPPPAVAKAAQRWVGMLLSEDPAPASVDLMIDPRASWRDLSRVVMGVSAIGLFRIHVIQQGPDQLLMLPGAAPVFGTETTPEDAAPLVVAMFPHEDGAAFRVRIGDQEYRPPESCAKDVSFCADSPDSYRASLAQAVESLVARSETRIAYVMFAAGPNTTVGEGLSYFQRTHGALGIPESKVFLGYIDEDTSGDIEGAQ